MDFLSSLAVLALSPAAATLFKVGCNAVQRYLEPYFYAHGERVKAKKELELYNEFPHKYLEYCAELISKLGDDRPEYLNQKLQNIGNVIKWAGDYLAADSDVSSDALPAETDEWFDRFFDEAQYASDEALQRIWGRLLKEKICNPNGVNNRVLYFIRDLQPSELEAIHRSLRFFIAEGVIPTALTGKFPCLEKDWFTLSGIKVIVAAPLSAFEQIIWKIDEPKNGCSIKANNASFVINDLVPGQELDFSCHSLSPEGQVLARMIDVSMSDDELKVYERFLNDIWKGRAVVSVVKEGNQLL